MPDFLAAVVAYANWPDVTGWDRHMRHGLPNEYPDRQEMAPND